MTGTVNIYTAGYSISTVYINFLLFRSLKCNREARQMRKKYLNGQGNYSFNSVKLIDYIILYFNILYNIILAYLFYIKYVFSNVNNICIFSTEKKHNSWFNHSLILDS